MTASAANDGRRLIDVALPIPLFRAFTYEVKGGTRHPVAAGSRVVVPVRGGREVGYCLGESDGAALGSVVPKAVIDVPDAEPAFRPDLLAVCRWMSEYYVAPLGLVLRAALPAALGARKRPEPAVKTRRVVRLAKALETLMERDRAFARAPQQRALYELLESAGGAAPVEWAVERLSCSDAVVTGLVKRGLATIEREGVARDPFDRRERKRATPHEPTPAQRAAIDALAAAAPGETFLLRGITGSGKTLVYLELLQQVLARGQTAIVLVPEIALTPQTVDRFRAVFGDDVAVLHSGLSDGERYDAWRALRAGHKRIAVGARSAVFAPLDRLGAIVVDEEHEATYKQGESPRYHAREVAIVRAREAGAVCVLGSATPSLESWVNATTGKYRLLTLPDRVGGGALPAVEVVDLRAGANAPRRTAAERAVRGILSAPLEHALNERLARGEQSILLLNRRGYSAFVQCTSCEWVAACPRCSISLTYHRAPERLVCHYCLHQEALHARCPQCGADTLRQRGLGTQQVERLVAEQLPSARIARMDVDTTSGKWAHADILDRVGQGDVDILLGTQMIAKGLDFPNVTLVGVIDADVGINLPDFRASERTFQLLSQVAGRAGRGPKGGRVIIQTRLPSHHAVRCAVTHDYEAFVAEELPGRQSPAWPPTVRLANVVFSGTEERAVLELAEGAAAWFATALAGPPAGAVEVIGPAPCPIERIKERWRWHLVLRGTHAGAVTRLARRFLTSFEVPGRADLRVSFDRDPVALL
ncbi:MAG: primosomal protein N' [Gemmatimonadetes bacterium]|nr:primosomal protein N' [Gemmatimonadota bacterium]